jgi:hypothetical protein
MPVSANPRELLMVASAVGTPLQIKGLIATLSKALAQTYNVGVKKEKACRIGRPWKMEKNGTFATTPILRIQQTLKAGNGDMRTAKVVS